MRHSSRPTLAGTASEMDAHQRLSRELTELKAQFAQGRHFRDFPFDLFLSPHLLFCKIPPLINCVVAPKAGLRWKRRRRRPSASADSLCDGTSKPDVSGIETAVTKRRSLKCKRSPNSAKRAARWRPLSPLVCTFRLPSQRCQRLIFMCLAVCLLEVLPVHLLQDHRRKTLPVFPVFRTLWAVLRHLPASVVPLFLLN
jgi:hypothetical protein